MARGHHLAPHFSLCLGGFSTLWCVLVMPFPLMLPPWLDFSLGLSVCSRTVLCGSLNAARPARAAVEDLQVFCSWHQRVVVCGVVAVCY